MPEACLDVAERRFAAVVLIQAHTRGFVAKTKYRRALAELRRIEGALHPSLNLA